VSLKVAVATRLVSRLRFAVESASDINVNATLYIDVIYSHNVPG
jgi:hypothetical protein